MVHVAGVGIGMVIVSGLVCVYYNVIVAWTIYYLFMSLRATLPWSTCDNWWNTDNCLDVEGSVNFASQNGTDLAGNMTSLVKSMTQSATVNYSVLGNVTGTLLKKASVSSSEEFWE